MGNFHSRNCSFFRWTNIFLKLIEFLFSLFVGPELAPALYVAGICLVLLVLMRSVRNLIAPPIVIVTDRKEFAFDFPTRFRVDVSIKCNFHCRQTERKNDQIELGKENEYRFFDCILVCTRLGGGKKLFFFQSQNNAKHGKALTYK